MKTKTTIIGIVMLCAALFAAEPPKLAKPPAAAEGDLFSAKEFTLDLSGVYGVGKAKLNDVFDQHYKHGDYGIAAGVTYWATEYFGAGADILLPAVDDVRGSIISDISLSLKGRYPIGKVAPYVLAGGGRNVKAGKYTVHAGVGLDYRFAKKWSAFGEFRTIWTDDHAYQAQPRLGISYVF